MKSILVFIMMYVTPVALIEAKVIEQDGEKYQCTRVKNCDEKLKAAYVEIAQLKKRRQQIKEVYVERIIEAPQNKNTLMLEGRRDHTNLSTKVSGSSVKVISQKSIILGLDYYRREILDSHLGLGVGIDSNSTFKALIGLDF